jgi:hypothetical protein
MAADVRREGAGDRRYRYGAVRPDGSVALTPGKISEACLRIESQDGPVCLYGVSGNNQVMRAAWWRSSPPGRRHQPRVASGRHLCVVEQPQQPT